MMRRLSHLLVCLLLLSAGHLRAEKVADLPLPTAYVNDFAGVLTPATRQTLEDLCLQLHQKANAEIAVVTINTLDDDQTIEEFTGQLEEKWKFGKKGSDRSAIYVLAVQSRKVRFEVGYGLEGILPDAKVGRILDQALPFEQQNDWNDAAKTAVNGIAQVIAADSQVALTPTVHRYHREGQTNGRRQGFSFGQLILGIIFLGIIATLILTGNGGWAMMLIWSLMGNGGGGGGGGRDDDDSGGGGFGGMGGGSSGGGGASRDF